MRWSLQTGYSPLPKIVKKDRIKENVDFYGFELTDGEMRIIDTGEYERCA